MSQILATFSVTPDHAQIVIKDENAHEVAIPDTGPEIVFAMADSLLVLTRPDYAGDVVIEIQRGRDRDRGKRVFAGELLLSAPRLVVGSMIGDDLRTVDIGRDGQIPIEIYVDDPAAAGRGHRSPALVLAG